MADELERDAALAERIAGTIDENKSKRPTRGRNAVIDFDPFDVLRQGTETALRARLEGLEIPALKRIITQHGLDTSRLAQKWRDKERLVTFILERIIARAEKGDVFREIGRAAVNQ
jgi:hypothetical protein